jgi:elongation factor G
VESYAPEKIRNVALLGHFNAGKTTLAEVMAFRSGAITRLGSVDEGTSVSDYDPSEISRHTGINLAMLPLEWKGFKVNLLDTPGYADFFGEVTASLRVSDAAAIAVGASTSVEVGTEQVWARARELGLPAMLIITKMDRENADFSKCMEGIRAKLSPRCVAIQMPIGAESSFAGYVDLVTLRAYLPEGEADVPAELKDAAVALRESLIEAIVEADDALMNKYLEGTALTTEEVATALRLATARGIAMPVVVSSAAKGIGVEAVLDTMCACLPSPVVRQAAASQPEPSDAGPLVALVFKTTADPFTGKVSYFRVYSGEVASNSQVLNVNKGATERIGQLFLPLGKQQLTVTKVSAGDIGAIAKLSVTGTGDTLGAKDQPALSGIAFPRATYSMSVQPETKGDLDKMSTILPRMQEEDPTLLLKRDADTGEMLITGLGDTHLEVVKDKMSRKFGVKVVLSTPSVPYKETITVATKAEYKHKKQTGGHGQYGHVMLELQPLPKGGGFEFEVKTVGGSIPNNFIPSVEKGVNEARHEGVLAGFPLVDVKVILYDGSFHPVDSSDIAFKIAAAQALKKGLREGQPVLQEPIMDLTIRVPEGMTGDVISDLNTKRGRVFGMNPEHGYNVITAQAPYAELLRYAIDLRSMLQGRADFDMVFSHFEEVPAHLSQRIVARQAEKAE